MKNTILARFAHAPLVRVPLVRIFGIIALTAVIVFSMAGCPEEEPEPEEEVKPIFFPEAIAGPFAPDFSSGGICWKSEVYDGFKYDIVLFINTTTTSIGECGYIVYQRFQTGDSEKRPSSDRYYIESKNGDTYKLKDTNSNSTMTFTAKVGADGKLTISDCSSYGSIAAGIYTKWTN